MGKLILLFIPVVQCDVNAFVVDAGDNANGCAGELGAQLIETAGGYAFLGAFSVVG